MSRPELRLFTLLPPEEQDQDLGMVLVRGCVVPGQNHPARTEEESAVLREAWECMRGVTPWVDPGKAFHVLACWTLQLRADTPGLSPEFVAWARAHTCGQHIARAPMAASLCAEVMRLNKSRRKRVMKSADFRRVKEVAKTARRKLYRGGEPPAELAAEIPALPVYPPWPRKMVRRTKGKGFKNCENRGQAYAGCITTNQRRSHGWFLMCETKAVDPSCKRKAGALGAGRTAKRSKRESSEQGGSNQSCQPK